ncbi:gliding motility protein [Flavobacterium sp. SM15]|uniref:type IX secretion system periplasmic lipoprotein PorW/SprE n=1 Tax=Flavobacterium sp. SM15 TaxID=2908005 RepID=UPI001EDC24C6|nr:gliding motility protein [Flavobacterium sp. SM15]MCG2610342.1 gliding motility protein [Flavobacterium sp. SM15]
MKANYKKYVLSVAAVVFLIACSTKRNSFVNRNFHAVTTEYNVLYNGQVAFDKGVEDLKVTYKDNFWDILPVERMQEKSEAMLPGQAKNSNFERAETKAVKAIQKHAMYIEGGEKNPQMDEAHLLLGKARYYDNRFLPALEAFNYILYKYSNSDKIYEAKVWREKTNIRLENDVQAIKNLKKLLKENKLKGQVKADANAILAQAYLNTNVKDTAIAKLKIARDLTDHKEEKARYHFILGQLYESLNYKDSAYTEFQNVIDMKRKAPRRYVVWAHAKQAQQFDYKSGDTLQFTEKFRDLLKDRENRPYLDVLNHQMAVFYDKQQLKDKAKKYYNKSLRSGVQDQYLTASNYRNLGELYFKEAKYKTAGMYYDSTLTHLNAKSREFISIKKKRENLADVIKYEGIVQANDSILKVVAMNENDRRNFYEAHIAQLKIADEKKALEEAKKAQQLQQQSQQQIQPQGGKGMPPGLNPDLMDDMSSVKGVGKKEIQIQAPVKDNVSTQAQGVEVQSNFYFYNPTTVAYGKTEFKKKWGTRAMKDNWRWSSSSTKDQSDDTETPDEVVKVDENPVIKTEKQEYSVDFYLKQLPTDSKVLDSLARDRNFAYFQLGTIYKEKFKEYELAASKLEKLLVSQPEERLLLPAKYNLYKIYEIINPAKAEALKQDIITNYPGSHYAQVLANPNSEIAKTLDNPQTVFNTLYKEYQKGNYQETLKQVEALLPGFSGDETAPKFEFLRANILGRLKGLEEYKKTLLEIAHNYPNIDEGKRADAIVKNDLPKLEQMALGAAPSSWKIVYQIPFPNDNDAKVKTLLTKLQKYVKDRDSKEIFLSNDVYTMDKSLVVIHGFSNKEGAQSTISVLKDFKGYKVSEPAFVISTEDYKVVQIKKLLEQYLAVVK